MRNDKYIELTITMKLITFKLIIWKKELEKKVKECNRIINFTDIRSLIKSYKNSRRNACKMIIEINEAIEILNNK